jgi:hypothetical protein
VITGASSVAGQVTGNRTTDFVNPSAYNLFPSATSHLKGSGVANYQAAYDFNWTPREESQPTAGAYVSATSNPGWTVVKGFKDSSAPPVTSSPDVSDDSATHPSGAFKAMLAYSLIVFCFAMLL